MSKKAVQGIDYVRPPELKFNTKKETNTYTTYEIETFKDAETPSSSSIFTRVAVESSVKLNYTPIS